MTNQTVAGLDAKALEAAQYTLEDAVRWGCEPVDGLASAIVTYLSALPHAGVSEEMVEAADENRIDELRLKAFKTNSEEDRTAYFSAVSKWFQDRHFRRMASETVLSSQHAEAVSVAKATKQEIEAAIADEWHKNGGWRGVKSGMVNMVGLLADRVVSPYASPVPADAGEPGLEAENERLRFALRQAPDARHFQILTEAMAEVKATSDGKSDQPVAAIVSGCIAEISALIPTTSPAKGGAEVRTADDCWQELIEKDDRTSPAEYPDMALITRAELAEFLRTSAPVGRQAKEGE